MWFYIVWMGDFKVLDKFGIFPPILNGKSSFNIIN